MLEFSDQDWAHFKSKVSAIAGVRLDDYKPEQMRRRIAAMAQRAGAGSFAAYLTRIERDPKEMAGFLARITINVSEMFRNPERFADLRGLFEGNAGGAIRRPLCVWSAGCSYGAEIYSLAILFDEMRLGRETRFLATDIDRDILERARTGRFQKAELHNLSPERRDTYFRETKEGECVVIDRLRSRVNFEEHDLLSDPYPEEEFDLIACRNVVIYFTDRAKRRVYENLLSALKPGGILFIGSTERIAEHREIGFELVMPFFYKKPAKTATNTEPARNKAA